MFMTGIFSGAGINILDPEQERDPPAAATPVTFPLPRVSPSPSSSWKDERPPPLRPLFCRILRPTDISEAHLVALNIRIETSCPPEDLIPLTHDGSSYMPSLSLPNSTPPSSYADAARTDDPVAKKRKDLVDRIAELRIDNDTGYRIINRTVKAGEKPPRLAYLRKFWEGLETMSPYWDASLDRYYEAPTTTDVPESVGKGSKRQKLDSTQPDMVTLPILNPAGDPKQVDSQSQAEEFQDVASRTPLPDGDDARSNSATPEASACLRYKGRRTASGRDMPDQFRAETVRYFVEGVVWGFRCSIAVPRQMPIVQMKTLNLPVRQSAAAYKVPTERAKARAGCLIGPVLTIQVRPETDFDAASLTEQQRDQKARLDLMRELGGLLQCAQERGRQGKTEVRPGAGKWWTEKPRWGGGPGGEVENERGNSDAPVKDVLAIAEEVVGAAREKTVKPSSRRLKKTPAMLWKELKCGSKLWDSKTEYEAIGKDPESEYDEIFMVSSLNHHISIVKLTVHTAYTEYIRSEEMPNPFPTDAGWCSPKMQRTQWYDLFNVEERIQAFRALWGITAYLTRETKSPPGETDQRNGSAKDA